jgi:hypothetical protein
VLSALPDQPKQARRLGEPAEVGLGRPGGPVASRQDVNAEGRPRGIRTSGSRDFSSEAGFQDWGCVRSLGRHCNSGLTAAWQGKAMGV